MEANVDFAGGDGGAAAAGAAAEGGSGSGASPPRRSRRSAGESAMPKVYGQVMCVSVGEPRRGASPPAAPSNETGRLGRSYASPPCCFLSRIISCNLMLKNARLLQTVVCVCACAGG